MNFMKVEIDKAIELSLKVLTKTGFSLKDSKLITKNLVDAELSEKRTHGLIRLREIRKYVESGVVSTSGKTEVIINKSTYLLIRANHKPAYIPIYESLDLAIKKTKKTGVCVVGIQNAEYGSGFIGSYARQAALSDLIFIGFNNSPGVLIPHGTKKALWGTNPFTVGVPTPDVPVVLDMASTQITWGDLMVAKQKNSLIETGVALNKQGQQTTDPVEAMEGGLLPIAGHKGSGLAFIIELIAGALTGSRVGQIVVGGWGTTYILINPKIFRPVDEFKRDVGEAIKELKSAPKLYGVSDIYYPGERSQQSRKNNINGGSIEVDEKLINDLEAVVQ